MVRKKQIDDYFTLNYRKIKQIATANIRKNKRQLDTEVLINECYLYIIEKKSNISSDSLEACIFNYLKQQTYWSDNPLTRKEIIKDNKPVFEVVDFEVDEDKYKAIEEVYSDENDMIKKIVHEVVVSKGITTCRGVASHFGISLASAHELLKNLKNDIYENYSKRKLQE
jgi:ribosomal protein S25